MERHGLPDMSFDEAFTQRLVVTARASELGLIERANREVFHKQGFALTRDTETGDLWLTPTADPEGWSYEAFPLGEIWTRSGKRHND